MIVRITKAQWFSKRKQRMKTDFNYPPYWNRGQLLDVRGYSNGSYLVRALDEPFELLKAISENPDQNKRGELEFDNSEQCQNFVSWWYAPQAGR